MVIFILGISPPFSTYRLFKETSSQLGSNGDEGKTQAVKTGSLYME
ncbi:MAG TPA: hypothetical protein VNK81_05470 [Thermodesulfobacteriota bacterium]|nr:hypothetical protein [Thermodesulfobacteriota bacterium]